MGKDQLICEVMDEKKWREAVQTLLNEAAESGDVNMAALARECGFTPSGLHNFMKQGHGGKEKIAKLESRLRMRGFGGSDAQPAPTPQASMDSDPNLVLAGQFQSVADILRANLPQEIKTDAYLSFVDSHSKAVKIWRTELQKRGNGHGDSPL